MGKYPFKKIYSNVKANRKVGLGMMGLANAATALGVPYESEDMEGFASFLSSFMSQKAFDASAGLAEKRGEFTNWKGSIYDPESKYAIKGKTRKVRNATTITIAPNGTTGRYADVEGGAEPVFALYYQKNLANGAVLYYSSPLFEEELKARGLYSEELIEKVKKAKSVQNLSEIPDDMKKRYKLSTEVNPEWHIKIQGALQVGRDGWGVDNAVSKTVNLPSDATPKDFLKIFNLSRKAGCKGTTAYRDGTIEGQPMTVGEKKKGSPLEKLVKFHVPIASSSVTLADNSNKYRVERGDDTFHIVVVDEFRKDPKTGNIYMFPRELFQQTAPPGDEIAVEFTSAGLDRTNILKEEDPNYVKLVQRWKSITGNRSTGFGPARINSPTHGVGLLFEHALLSRGILAYDKDTKTIYQTIHKKDTVPLTKEEKENLHDGDEKVEQKVTSKIISGFLCGDCGSTEYMFEQGCHEPKCKKCGWAKTGGCS
jgi:ribonucleotide reductase alpha subunit